MSEWESNYPAALDRRVHAKNGGAEVVRYDRAGHWYIELAADWGRKGLPAQRRKVSLDEAFDHAVFLWCQGGEIFPGQPGGKAFDLLLEKSHLARVAP